MSEWVELQTTFLRTLTGCEVVRWQGIEMALREAGPSGIPDWRDASAPFLQLYRLDAVLADGREISITTYQNDDRWGLYWTDALPMSRLRRDEPNGIFRLPGLDTLPKGKIRAVSVVLDEGDIAAVTLDVAGRNVRLWAGEVYEQNDGSLQVVPMDESVLVQVDGRHPEARSHAEPGAAADGGA